MVCKNSAVIGIFYIHAYQAQVKTLEDCKNQIKPWCLTQRKKRTFSQLVSLCIFTDNAQHCIQTCLMITSAVCGHVLINKNTAVSSNSFQNLLFYHNRPFCSHIKWICIFLFCLFLWYKFSKIIDKRISHYITFTFRAFGRHLYSEQR